jgi:uncharacterized protein
MTMGELHLLLKIQQLELKLDKLQKTLKELPVFAEFKVLQVQAADAKEALGWAEGKLQEHQKRTRRLESRLHMTEEEHKELRSRLYSATGQSARELEQLERKEQTLRAERNKQEEDLLLAMQGTEDLEAALARASAENSELQKQLREKQKAGNEEINRLKEEIRACREERDQLLSKIAVSLVEEYREIRKRFAGRPIAVLEGEICGGCRVSVSSRIRAKLHDPAAKIYCENCGRILVLPGQRE